MLIFGEKINTINKAVAQSVEKKGKKFFQELTQGGFEDSGWGRSSN